MSEEESEEEYPPWLSVILDDDVQFWDEVVVLEPASEFFVGLLLACAAAPCVRSWGVPSSSSPQLILPHALCAFCMCPR